jgi:UDP-4-amino-4,6-dideoxy-N-acetyl-beta-L-altrosamine transaminase
MITLAIEGGTPVRNTMLNYGRQSIDEEDIAAVVQVLKGDWLTTGPTVAAFEKAVADFLGAKEAVAVNSGTAALHAAAFAAEIGPGDEVIVPAITFVASSNCVLYMGGKPVFADLVPGTLNLDPADVERKITPKTKAIVAVDYAGQPCEHAKLRALADRHKLIVIEDASHALGATYHGRKVGTLHEFTTLSFHPVKHITTAEGGMIVTNDTALAIKMRSFRTHGIDLDFHKRAESNLWLYDVVTLGYNYRLPDINCALGLSQLAKLSGWLNRRREIAACYNRAFASTTEIELPVIIPDCEAAWHLYVIRLNLDRLRAGRAEIFKALRAENIGVNVHYIPIPWLTNYQKMGYSKGQWPVAESEYERILSLPIFPGMSDDDVDDVIIAVKKVLEHYSVAH